ncbi:hypothetical protein ABD86_23765 [Paenibacillus alvei]|nr:hypothetical protein [Paenibacillus alvei]MBG9746775.1 hypothetical protein [Paenibacillus alvei]
MGIVGVKRTDCKEELFEWLAKREFNIPHTGINKIEQVRIGGIEQRSSYSAYAPWRSWSAMVGSADRALSRV